MADASQEEVLKQYEGWEPEVRAVLEVRCLITSNRVFKLTLWCSVSAYLLDGVLSPISLIGSV